MFSIGKRCTAGASVDYFAEAKSVLTAGGPKLQAQAGNKYVRVFSASYISANYFSPGEFYGVADFMSSSFSSYMAWHFSAIAWNGASTLLPRSCKTAKSYNATHESPRKCNVPRCGCHATSQQPTARFKIHRISHGSSSTRLRIGN